MSCGVPAKKTISSYIKQFEKDIGKKVTTRIYFDNLPERVAGRCFSFLNLVQLNLSSYINYDEYEKKALIYHELGHCLCGSGHDVQLKDFCPKSLMYPAMWSSYCYKLKWKIYLSDLRSRCQK